MLPLVITIVVLIILAGVLINISLGNNGLFNKAKTAKEKYINAQDYEETEIGKLSNQIDNYVIAGTRTSEYPGEYRFINGNSAGFMVKSGEVYFKSYGITFKTFPTNGNSWSNVIIEKNYQKTLKNKFEISSSIFFNNDNNNYMGELFIKLYNGEQKIAELNIGDYWAGNSRN